MRKKIGLMNWRKIISICLVAACFWISGCATTEEQLAWEEEGKVQGTPDEIRSKMMRSGMNRMSGQTTGRGFGPGGQSGGGF